jgi:ATP-dependent helicase HepA
MYSLHQRWSSQTEPELGPGTVIKIGQGRVTLHFPAADETRMYAETSAPLLRISFKTGDDIVNEEGQTATVSEVQSDGELFIYRTDIGLIKEADLGVVTIMHGPEDRLLAGDVDSKTHFELRQRALDLDFTHRKSPVRGFVGGRINLIPHQLYIAGEVSSRYAPRVLLSDEVGLGKPA